MEIMDIIHARRSVRTFDGTPLSEDDADKLIEFASKLENPYDQAIEWKLLDARKEGLSSPVISGTDTFLAGKMRRRPHAEEAFGYTFEKVILYAESLGIGTTIIAGTMNRKVFEQVMRVSEDEVLPCVTPLGYPAEKMSLKEVMMRKGIKADSRLDFEELFFDGAFKKPLPKEKAGELALPLEAVRLAPSAVNRQPWRVVVCKDKVHFYEKPAKGMSSGDWDIQKVDMGIALCHFELVAAEYGKQTVFEVDDPGISAGDGLVYTASFTLV